MPISIDGLMILAARALASGGRRVSPLVVEWDVSGRCETPVERDLEAAPYREGQVREWDPRTFASGRKPVWRSAAKFLPKWRHGFTVRMTVKCRKCNRCRMEKSMDWQRRAQSETRIAQRTWFGTITLAPHHHNRFLNLARARESRSGINLDTLPREQQIAAVHRQVAIEITKYLKRVRKQAGASMRFLLVMESVVNHQDGMPHYHALVHEKLGSKPIRYAALSGQWRLGFTKWKLVSSPREVTYVTKYVSKDTQARVRASVRYGNTSLDIAAVKAAWDTPFTIPSPEVEIPEGFRIVEPVQRSNLGEEPSHAIPEAK